MHKRITKFVKHQQIVIKKNTILRKYLMDFFNKSRSCT